MKKQEYTQGKKDHTLFVKFSSTVKVTVLIIYIDDIILTRDVVMEIERLKKCLATEFEIKDLGSLRYFLDMEVALLKKGIIVSQRKYLLDLSKEIGMSRCRPSEVPMDPNLKLGNSEKKVPIDTTRYHKLFENMIYL